MLIILCVTVVSNAEATKDVIKAFLEWKFLNWTLWCGFFCCFLVHYLSVRNDHTQEHGLIYTHFGKFADSGFAMVTYGIASTTAASILKGVYIQQVIGSDIYFLKFDQIDIYSMLVVCLFLFGYSLFAALIALKNALVISNSSPAIPVIDN
jgi:hypothetical protein